MSGNEKGRGIDKTTQQTPATTPPPQHILRIIPFFHIQLPLSLILSNMQSFIHLEEGLVASEQKLDRIETQKWAFGLVRDQLDVRTFSTRTLQDDPFSLLRQNCTPSDEGRISSVGFSNINLQSSFPTLSLSLSAVCPDVTNDDKTAIRRLRTLIRT
ncbi:hypothetical protein BLNAU_16105 [Blattamonas nauphoetae]|uniref:Uncharacterized protein n=1 Tax=Blattamonas nauphoetae TaxID=2049346 RepID=A0ABQ9XDQ9_9EUKA|nr:hypothetical protein BLNAU_16105 [Blattamonas nauphoetae]